MSSCHTRDDGCDPCEPHTHHDRVQLPRELVLDVAAALLADPAAEFAMVEAVVLADGADVWSDYTWWTYGVDVDA